MRGRVQRRAPLRLRLDRRRRHLLIRRNLHDPARVDYFWCFVPDGRPVCLPILAAVCGRRWTVGEDHEFGKDQFGYDHAQVRLHTPIMRHLTLVMAALAICAVTAAELRATSPPLPVPTRAGQQPPTTPASSRSPFPRSNGSTCCSTRSCTASLTDCAGPDGDASTRPAPAGTTTAPGYAARRPSHDQVTKYGCRIRG